MVARERVFARDNLHLGGVGDEFPAVGDERDPYVIYVTQSIAFFSCRLLSIFW